MTSSIDRPLRERIERPSAETTPAVTVDSNPSGFPIATTRWPRRSLRIPQPRCVRIARQLAAQQREIGIGIVADHLGVARVPLRQHEPHTPRAADDVAVGQHEPVTRDDHARSHAAATIAYRIDAHH